MSAPVREAGGMQAEQASGAARLSLVEQRPELTVHSAEADASLGISTRGAIIGVIAALCAIGLVMVLSASAWTSLSLNGSVWSIFERQALWMGIGVAAFVATARVDYRHWRKVRLLLGGLAIALCVLVLVPGIGLDAGGSSRWIGIGQLRLQPSELMKLAVVMFGADLLTRRAELLGRSRSVVLPLLSWLGVSCLLLIAQPDMGTAIVVTCITFSLLFA